MNKETVNTILTILAIMPMTFFLALSIYGLSAILSNFDADDTLILISIVFGILGYVGLLMNLKQEKSKGGELVNLIFLLLGILGFILFTSFQGGIIAWKWIITIDELDEWLVFVGPVLITIYLTIIKVKQFTKLHLKS